MDVQRRARKFAMNGTTIVPTILIVALFLAAVGPVAATSHGCLFVTTQDADGEGEYTLVYLESVDGDTQFTGLTSDDSSCSRDGAEETSFESYIFDVPSGEYYLQVIDGDTNEFWGLYEVYVIEEAVTSDNVVNNERGAVYSTDSSISSPRDTTRFVPGETATLNLDVYNGQPSGSNDIAVNVYVHAPDESPSTATESFSYTISAQQSDTLTPEFTVPDSEGEYEVYAEIETDSGVFGYLVSDGFSVGTINVDAFEPPRIDSSTPSESFVDVQSDEATTFSVSTSDPDSTSLTHTWYVENEGQVATGDSFTLNPGEYSEGEHLVQVKVSDGTRESGIASEVWRIDIAYEPPSIDSSTPDDTHVNVQSDETTTFSVSTSDPDSTSLTHTWYVDNQEVAAGDSFTLDPGEYSEGEHSVEVEVSDGATETQNRLKSWTIDVAYEPPEIDSTDPSDVAVEAAGSDPIGFSVSSSDSDSTSLSHTWYVDGQEVASGTSYTLDPSDYRGGEHNVEVVVSDDSTETSDASNSWTVELIEGPEISRVEPGSSSVDIGSSVIFGADATDPGGYTPLSYEWRIDGQRYDGAEVSETFTSKGEVAAEVEVTNSQDVSTTQSFTVDVKAVRPQIEDITGGGAEITAGESVTLSATASDPAGRDLSMSYNWDVLSDTYDGSSVTVSPTEVGEHDITLTVTNEYGTSTTKEITITVNNDVPELTATDNSDRSLTAGQFERFTVSLADSDASDTDLDFVINGETVEERQVSQTEADETFSHQFNTPGRHAVELTATDGNGASTTVSWNVNAASRPPEFKTWGPEESDLHALTGSTFEFNATASDPDEQPVSYQWYIDGNYTTSGQSLVQQFNENGQYTVQVVATDPDNTTSERTWDVTISSFNEEPIIDNQVSAVNITEDSATEFATVSLSNPDVNNRAAEVEIFVQPPDGLSVNSATNVRSGSPAQYQVSESAQPGSSTSLTLGLQLDDESLLGQTVTVDYSVIYFPEGQRTDSVVVENSTQEISISGRAGSESSPNDPPTSDSSSGGPGTSNSSSSPIDGLGDGFTAVIAIVSILSLVYFLSRPR